MHFEIRERRALWDLMRKKESMNDLKLGENKQ